jgi:hypothetical protein
MVLSSMTDPAVTVTDAGVVVTDAGVIHDRLCRHDDGCGWCHP